LSAAGSLVASHASLSWLESIGSNLAAGFLGSFITVLLIDRAIAKEHDRESRRVRALALGQLRPFTLQLLELLFSWLRAAVKHPPQEKLSEIVEIFSQEYYRELRFFDFSKPAPVTPQMTWFRWSAMVINQFRGATSNVLDKYAMFLDGETLELLEAFANSNSLGFIASSMAGWPTDKPPTVGHRTYNVLAGEGMEEALRTDIEMFLKFISKLNQYLTRPITIADLYLWRPDVGGPIGNARMTDDEFANSNPMVGTGRRLPPVGPPAQPGVIGT
jgi:hypothetical protein